MSERKIRAALNAIRSELEPPAADRSGSAGDAPESKKRDDLLSPPGDPCAAPEAEPEPEPQVRSQRLERWGSRMAQVAGLICSATLLGCYSAPPPPPPDPQYQRDADCARRFISPQIPTPQDVAFLYPTMLNPRDPQGRPVFTAARQEQGGPNGGYCYVERGPLPPGVPLASLAPNPPGIPASREPMPCPPIMQDPRWWVCPEGRIVTNAAHCPCACFTSNPLTPPTLMPIQCPPTG